MKLQPRPQQPGNIVATLCASIVAIDFETSGHASNAACALGMARIESGNVVDTFYSLIRPPSSKILFTQIHGLTWAMLESAPRFATLWPKIAGFLANADYLLAHNAPFDRKVLYGCCQHIGVSVPEQPFLCTLKGCRMVFDLPSNSLATVCAHFGIPLQHHNAASDAMACANIYLQLRKAGLSHDKLQLKPFANIKTFF